MNLALTKNLINSYISDLTFINIIPKEYSSNSNTSSPIEKKILLEHVSWMCYDILELIIKIELEQHNRIVPDHDSINKIIIDVGFIQGSLWSVGFYSHFKILNDKICY